MKNLYEFLMELYDSYKDKEKLSLDKFIDNFLEESLGLGAIHEAFCGDKFLTNFSINYEINHENREIKLFFDRI
ncbi:hypothetical protein [Clostridium manihotivorum]|uniref:Uncharacterized protein n=1 Tax=Clostridium manihotivorum TaxID=2320868 RepID=A0A3R5X0H7_9CLOT|nr:hypothetical protein [Clostridium manihotivorum]QAA31262.1 hypothetical protein C1I91_06155 [Clostridium manihotivorum]